MTDHPDERPSFMTFSETSVPICMLLWVKRAEQGLLRSLFPVYQANPSDT